MLSYELKRDFCDAAQHTFYIDAKGNMYPCRNYKCKIEVSHLCRQDYYVVADFALNLVKKGVYQIS